MNSIGVNINKRIDTIETKITQVNALTTNINNLLLVVRLLIEKARLNTAST
jgi:hypothetical protein